MTRACIFAGTNIKDRLWFELVDWLIAQGARNLTIALDKCELLPCTEHKMKRWLAQKNVRVQLTSAAKLDDKPEAISFVKEVEKFAPLEAVFFVSTVRVHRYWPSWTMQTY